MSKAYNTDGMLTFPAVSQPPILNALDSIEAAIAFSVRDYGQERRDAWIYAIVFGWDDAWDEVAGYHGWDDEDKVRAEKLHQQWVKAQQWLKANGGEVG